MTRAERLTENESRNYSLFRGAGISREPGTQNTGLRTSWAKPVSMESGPASVGIP
jgi:hypothetical protein